MTSALESLRSQTWVRSYCQAAQWIAWFLILCGGLQVASMIVPVLTDLLTDPADLESPQFHAKISRTLADLHSMFFPGLALLILGRFVRFLLTPEESPGVLLRRGAAIFYAMALIQILEALWLLGYLPQTYWGTLSAYNETVQVLRFLVGQTGRILIYCGLGFALGRLLPVVNEAKTLA